MKDIPAFAEPRKPPARKKKLSQDEYRWYRRDPSKALAGMRGMNPEQKGVYGVIIDLCYEQRGPLPDDDRIIARACDCDVRQYRRIKNELLKLGRIVADAEAGTIYDERAVRELVAAQMLSETQVERAGKRKQSAKIVQLRAVETAPEPPQTAPETVVSEPRSGLARPLASPQLGGELGPKSECFSNEIKGPSPTKRKEKNRKTTSTVEPTWSDAAPRAPPCRLDGGGARVAPKTPLRRRGVGPEPPTLTPEQRAERLADQRARLRAAFPDEFDPDCKEDAA